MLKYFHDKIAENPSFQYALQLDCEEHITNIFWVDAKMIIDYAFFGDVVTFDTTFGTNKEYTSFGVFLGGISFEKPLFLVLHFCLMKPKHHLHGSLRLFLLHIIESNLELFTQIKMQQWKKLRRKYLQSHIMDCVPYK